MQTIQLIHGHSFYGGACRFGLQGFLRYAVRVGAIATGASSLSCAGWEIYKKNYVKGKAKLRLIYALKGNAIHLSKDSS